MRYALFLGCKIPAYVPAYQASLRRVLDHLEVELAEPEFSCCGYPLTHLYFDSYLLAVARNLAIAEAQGLDLLTPCKCCFGAFKRGMAHLDQHPGLREKVNRALGQEGLRYAGRAQVKHLLQVLDQDMGALGDKVTRPLRGLKVASMYGCHALRPSKITGFDNPYAPSLIDRLVRLTGADSVPWEGWLSCCGAPLRHINDEISLAMITSRLRESRRGRADVLLVNCPYSQMQADWAYERAGKVGAEELVAGTVLYPQLLGLAMGLSPAELGLELSRSNAIFLVEFLPPAGRAG